MLCTLLYEYHDICLLHVFAAVHALRDTPVCASVTLEISSRVMSAPDAGISSGTASRRTSSKIDGRPRQASTAAPPGAVTGVTAKTGMPDPGSLASRASRMIC